MAGSTAQGYQNLLPTQVALGAGASGTSTFAIFNPVGVSYNTDASKYSGVGAGLPVPLTAAVTGSGTIQTVNVSSNVPFKPGDLWGVGLGTAAQEVVLMSTTTGTTQMSAIFLNSHASGDVMQKIYGVATCSMIIAFSTIPVAGLANVNFIRYNTLPTNAYDQYVITGSFGSWGYFGDDATAWILGSSLFISGSVPSAPLIVPQYDSALVSATGNPTNAISVYSPTVTSAALYPTIRLQALYTSPTPINTGNLQYAYWWDDV